MLMHREFAHEPTKWLATTSVVRNCSKADYMLGDKAQMAFDLMITLFVRYGLDMLF